MRSAARLIHVILSLLLAAGLVVQVFLAGLGVFESPARFTIHRDFGYTLSFLPLLLIIAGLVGGMGRRVALLALAAGLLFVLQSVFVAFRASAPVVAALHPVNGFLILLIALVIARDSVAAWARSRSPQPLSSP
jgi:hypothetical protein